MSRILSPRWAAAAGVAAALAGTAIGAGVVQAQSAGRSDSGTIYAAVVNHHGNVLDVAGSATDKLLGAGAVTYQLVPGVASKPGQIATSGSVISYTATGALSGTVSAVETLLAHGTVTEKGTFHLTKGTGGQKGHSYVGTVTGTGASATGPWVFHITGIYR